MLPGIGLVELLVVAIAALLVVGPRELPKLLRQVGQFVGHIRRMGREFQRSFDDLGRELELDELRKEIQAIKRGDVGVIGDIKQDLADIGRDIDRDSDGQHDDRQCDGRGNVFSGDGDDAGPSLDPGPNPGPVPGPNPGPEPAATAEGPAGNRPSAAPMAPSVRRPTAKDGA